MIVSESESDAVRMTIGQVTEPVIKTFHDDRHYLRIEDAETYPRADFYADIHNYVRFKTPVMKFTQLSGCFVATAAYGSEMEPEVAALRSARDDLRPRSALFAAAIELYYRSGPAAAAVIGRSDTARALARRLIGPVAELAQAASQLPRP